MRLQAPCPLTTGHQLDTFSCGESVLDEWLRRRALVNQISGASRTFVVANEEERVVGYYALAAGAISRKESTGDIRRNMPEPIPVLVLGRLAVDLSMQGQKIGGGMLRDALNRAMRVSEHAGVRALVVHCLHERAKGFYEHYGFQPSPIEPLVVMIRLEGAAVIQR